MIMRKKLTMLPSELLPNVFPSGFEHCGSTYIEGLVPYCRILIFNLFEELQKIIL